MSERDRVSSAILPFVSVFVALIAFLVLQDAAFLASDGNFHYPVPGVYAHLALAELIRDSALADIPRLLAQGSSSPIYSMLLVPFAKTSMFIYAPLGFAIIGLIGASAAWGRILWLSGYSNSMLGMIIAAAGPIVLTFVGLAFSGTEHILHLAACLVLVSGVLQFSDHARAGRAIKLGALFVPLFRVEGLVLAVLVALFALARLRLRLAILLLMLALIPSAAAVYGLMLLGVDPLTIHMLESVTYPASLDPVVWRSALLNRVALIAASPNALILAGLVAVAIFVFFSAPWRKGMIAVVTLAGIAHLIFGKLGQSDGMDLFEVYIVSSLVISLSAATVTFKRLQFLAVLPIIYAGSVYAPNLIFNAPKLPGELARVNAAPDQIVSQPLPAPTAPSEITETELPEDLGDPTDTATGPDEIEEQPDIIVAEDPQNEEQIEEDFAGLEAEATQAPEITQAPETNENSAPVATVTEQSAEEPTEPAIESPQPLPIEGEGIQSNPEVTVEEPTPSAPSYVFNLPQDEGVTGFARAPGNWSATVSANYQFDLEPGEQPGFTTGSSQ